MKKLIFTSVISLGIAVLAFTAIPSTPKYNDSGRTADQEQKKEASVKTVYTCPMHPEVVQDKAGKCPKCGMNLMAKEVKKEVYTCPMHPEIVQDKPGKCPKCGMNLALKQPEKTGTVKK